MARVSVWLRDAWLGLGGEQRLRLGLGLRLGLRQSRIQSWRSKQRPPRRCGAWRMSPLGFKEERWARGRGGSLWMEKRGGLLLSSRRGYGLGLGLGLGWLPLRARKPSGDDASARCKLRSDEYTRQTSTQKVNQRDVRLQEVVTRLERVPLETREAERDPSFQQH